MKRIAFKMFLKPGFEEEYKKRHDEIWPELQNLIQSSGIHDYSIFLDEGTLTLFAVQKVEDDHDSSNLAQSPIMQKWWTYMADIMETNADDSPKTQPLKEVFYLP